MEEEVMILQSARARINTRRNVNKLTAYNVSARDFF